MKHICFVIHQYANPIFPHAMNFVQNLAWKLKDLGHEVTIISPLAINITPKLIKVPYHMQEKTPNGNIINIYYPKTFGLGQSHYIFGKSPVGITTKFMYKAALKVIRHENITADIFYGHFLAPSGMVVAKLAKKFNKPSVIAIGEAHDTINQFGEKKIKENLQYVNGIIAVSSELKRYVTIQHKVYDQEKVIVLPNGYDEDKFKYISKEEAREKLELPKDDIIGCFVGAFNSRKGVLRVCEAFESIENAKLICAGYGNEKPYGKNLLFAKHVQPYETYLIYYASDFFVLPTLAEGCCNAIVEAIGCGLPIISSDKPFNDDILDEKYSIKINPENIDDIKNAILKIARNDKLRLEMSKNAKDKAKDFTLSMRAIKISNFIEKI